MAKPTVAIRVDQALYDEIVVIAETRDCTITQALDIYIHRQRRKSGSKNASATGGIAGSKPKKTRKRTSKPETNGCESESAFDKWFNGKG